LNPVLGAGKQMANVAITLGAKVPHIVFQ
jgi:hypothetical protein